MPKKRPLKGKPEVHDALEGFEIKINEFGEITSNYDISKLNDFLNERIQDKKLGQKDSDRSMSQNSEEEQ